MLCAPRSCLSELELQLLIVFSGKTVGKQIFFTVKPFVFALVQYAKEQSNALAY